MKREKILGGPDLTRQALKGRNSSSHSPLALKIQAALFDKRRKAQGSNDLKQENWDLHHITPKK